MSFPSRNYQNHHPVQKRSAFLKKKPLWLRQQKKEICDQSTIDSDEQQPQKKQKVRYIEKTSSKSFQSVQTPKKSDKNMQFCEEKAQFLAKEVRCVQCVAPQLLVKESSLYFSYTWESLIQIIKPAKLNRRNSKNCFCGLLIPAGAPMCIRCFAIYCYNKTVNLQYFSEKDYDFSVFWESQFAIKPKNCHTSQEEESTSVDLSYIQKLLK